MTSIAIIGAGLAGLTAGRLLQPYYDIQVFDKSRGVSGRLSTRYADPFQFDHGAQYFTAHSEAFKALVADLQQAGVIAPWDGQFVTIDGVSVTPILPANPRYVAVARMNDFGKYLAQGLACHLGDAVTGISQCEQDRWQLEFMSGALTRDFDAVICAVPEPQFAALIGPLRSAQDPRTDPVVMQGCYSLMMGDEALDLPDFDAARVEGSALGWIAVNNRKPGRAKAPSLLVQSSNDWADSYREADQDWVRAQLIAETEKLLGAPYAAAAHISLHRWRYAKVKTPYGQPFWQAVDKPIFAIGDWCLGGRVEQAFLSGHALANHLIDSHL